MKKHDISKQTLNHDFTARVMRAATLAKKRQTNRQVFIAAIKEPLSMKSLQFLKTTPGLVAIFAILATGGASAYALTNWFGASVDVEQTDNTVVVSADGCPTFKLQYLYNRAGFKITDPLKVTAQDVKDAILADCETHAASDFLADRLPDAFANYRDVEAKAYDTPSESKEQLQTDAAAQPLQPFIGEARVTAVSGSTISVQIDTAREKNVPMTWTVASDAKIFDTNNTASLQSIKTGDSIEVAITSPTNAPDLLPSDETKISKDATVVGIVKLQYSYAQLEKYQTVVQNTERVGFGRHVYDAKLHKEVPVDDKTTIK